MLAFKTSFRVAAILAAVIALSACGVHTVETGQRGIKVSFGQVVGEPLPEDIYFVNPVTTTIHMVDTRVQSWQADASPFTKDVQEADCSFTLNYKLRQEAVGRVYKAVGENWTQGLGVGAETHQRIKDEVGKWDAVDLIANRQKVTDNILRDLKTALGARDVDVTGFYITDIKYKPAFNASVERKVIAAQDALAAANKTDQIKQEAAQRLIAAEAEAKSMKIRADALTQNGSLVQWEAVQKWDGHLPQYTLGGATPFINVTPGK